MKNLRGLTGVELISAIVLLLIVGGVIYASQSSFEAVHRDQERKTAINAMHYNLQEIVKPKLGGYPRTLSASQLTAMDATLLKDPEGVMVGEPGSDYRYEPTGCRGGDICTGYTLTAHLEHETDFVKQDS